MIFKIKLYNCRPSFWSISFWDILRANFHRFEEFLAAGMGEWHGRSDLLGKKSEVDTLHGDILAVKEERMGAGEGVVFLRGNERSTCSKEIPEKGYKPLGWSGCCMGRGKREILEGDSGK